MAIDGLLPKMFGNISEKYGTPVFGSILSGLLALVIGTFINFDLLAEMISVGTLFAYVLVCAGVISMRYPIKTGLLLLLFFLFFFFEKKGMHVCVSVCVCVCVFLCKKTKILKKKVSNYKKNTFIKNARKKKRIMDAN